MAREASVSTAAIAPTSGLSANSVTILAKKLDHQLSNILQILDHDPLTYAEMVEVLKNFDQDLYKSQGEKDGLAKDAWTILGGSARDGVSKQALATLVRAIAATPQSVLGAIATTLDLQTAESKENDHACQLTSIGRYDDQGAFVLNEEERRWLRHKYAQRILTSTLTYRRSSNPAVVTSANFSFTPHVSSRSNALAAVLKQKLIYTATQEPLDAQVVSIKQLHNQSISDILTYKQSIADE